MLANFQLMQLRGTKANPDIKELQVFSTIIESIEFEGNAEPVGFVEVFPEKALFRMSLR